MYLELLDLLDSYPDTAVSFGEPCLTEFVALVENLKTKKIVAFTGRSSADKNGAWNKITTALTHAKANIVRFSDIEPEPCTETVDRMVEFLRKETPEQVIAVGGGSVMDAAKAAYLVFQTGMPLEDCFGMNKFSSVNPGKKLKKVFCFPTTSGTGSEVTPYSNIVDRNLEVKKLIVEKEIIPEFSFLIPEFTYSMPHDVTLATAFDAMAHSIEGFLNTGQDNNHPKANKWALESIKLIVEHLPRVLADSENRESREALAAAACLGGMVIRYKSTGLPHLCSFSWFGKIAHGIAVSVLLPYAWSYYLGNEKVKARTMELEGVFPGDVKTASDIIKNYIDFAQSSGIRPALKFYPEITPELLRVTARTAGENKMKLDLAPKPVPLEKSFEILSGILKDAREGTIRDAEKF